MQFSKSKGRPEAQVTTVQPFQIRGRFFTALALRIAGAPDEAFFAALDTQLQQTPRFFAEAPLVIDLDQVKGTLRGDELVHIVHKLRSRKLSVFGFQHGSKEQASAAGSVGLIELFGGREAPARAAARKESAPAAPATEAPAPENKLITTPVRSGQTVFADRGDLVVVGPVGSGAELVAAGNIHVYGTLRGRALAGVNGDESARIFCQSLDADLLAISGLYRTNESLDASVRKQSVQVFLQGEDLRIEPLGNPQTRDRSAQ
ncbi:septum site-determining protein MinC [Tranquillimonas alkanivorans]|uniref:septum site-determining protein MinC n=1 Tax=Tranquillimonas alkanivorans TaxID=441119 RepID=UPI001FE05850|nr:septum site-determining protein MinC [Tranquillimonas alkanivorans]